MLPTNNLKHHCMHFDPLPHSNVTNIDSADIFTYLLSFLNDETQTSVFATVEKAKKCTFGSEYSPVQRSLFTVQLILQCIGTSAQLATLATQLRALCIHIFVCVCVCVCLCACSAINLPLFCVQIFSVHANINWLAGLCRLTACCHMVAMAKSAINCELWHAQWSSCTHTHMHKHHSVPLAIWQFEVQQPAVIFIYEFRFICAFICINYVWGKEQQSVCIIVYIFHSQFYLLVMLVSCILIDI